MSKRSLSKEINGEVAVARHCQHKFHITSQFYRSVVWTSFFFCVSVPMGGILYPGLAWLEVLSGPGGAMEEFTDLIQVGKKTALVRDASFAS